MTESKIVIPFKRAELVDTAEVTAPRLIHPCRWCGLEIVCCEPDICGPEVLAFCEAEECQAEARAYVNWRL